MTENLKIELSMVDVEGGVVDTSLATKEELAAAVETKADLIQGKVPVIQLPEFNEISGVSEAINGVETKLRDEMATTMANNNNGLESRIDEKLVLKADLVNGRVPASQSPAFKNVEGAKGALDGLKEALTAKYDQKVKELSEGKADLVDGKIPTSQLPIDGIVTPLEFQLKSQELDKKFETLEDSVEAEKNAFIIQAGKLIAGNTNAVDAYNKVTVDNKLSEKVDKTDLVDNKINTWSGLTQEEKNKELISAQDFGAKGDGTTDDTISFDNLETAYRGRIIDLLGKTYKVSVKPILNTYINGYFSLPSGGSQSLELVDKAINYKSAYLQNSNSGYLHKSLCVTNATSGSSRILQSFAYDFLTNNLFTIKSADSGGGMAVETFDINGVGADVTASAVSAITDKIGHQGLGIQIVRNNGRYFWATAGTAQADSRTFVRFKFTNNVFSDHTEFTLFGSDFNQVNATATIAVSSDYKTIVVFGVRTSDNMRVLRVFDANIFAYSGGGDFSKNYLYEFAMANPYSKTFAGLAVDSEFVYFLGSTPVTGTTAVSINTATQHMQVYTLDGRLVVNDAYCRIGLSAATSQGATASDGQYFYEPEGLGWIGSEAAPLLTVLGASAVSADGAFRYNNLHTVKNPALQAVRVKRIEYSDKIFDQTGVGSPEGVVTASKGATYRRTDGVVGGTLYVKETGTGNTGWVLSNDGATGLDAPYIPNCGNGFKLFELNTTVTDPESTGSTIVQGLAVFPQTGSIYAQHIYQGTDTATETCSIIKYAYGVNNILEPISRSNSTGVIGHQGLGLTRENGELFFWSTVGSERYNERARYVAKFQWNESTGDIYNIRYFKVFGDKHVANNTRCIGVSPNFTTLVVSNALIEGNTWVIRVFDPSVFKTNDGDYSNNYLYEFPFSQRGRPVQSITTDGKFVYILHGAADGFTTSVIDVYTLSGKLVLSDDKCQIANGDASGHSYYFYEPEVLFILPNNDLGFVTAIGKTGGAGTTTPHRNIVSTSKYPETLTLKQLDNRPAMYINAPTAVCVPANSNYKIVESDRSGVLTDRFNVAPSYTYVFPKEASGGFWVSNKKVNGQSQFRMETLLRNVMLQVSQSGSVGLYDVSTNKWLYVFDVNGIATINHAPNVIEKTGTGSPEGSLVAGVGSRYFRTDGGAGTTFYVKESGTGNTGWIAK